jgi:hypothetical protein
MTMSEADLHYALVPRSELANALRGDRQRGGVPAKGRVLPRLSQKDALVFWERDSYRPCIVAVDDADRDELFNWATTFHRDLSPITSWCHVLSIREVERLSESTRLEAKLFGIEAAWAGAAIAEAMILSRRSYETISLPSCLATDTFAIARSAALYGSKSVYESQERLTRVRDRLKRGSEPRPTQVPISVLLRLLPDALPTTTSVQQTLIAACRTLLTAEDTKREVSSAIFRELASKVARLSNLENLDEVSAEQRVKLLRDIPAWISASKDDEERELLCFSAGYIISRIGGAERDLRLAESFDSRYPNVLTWAAVIGGLGVTTYWSDAFGGIGRLVARELSRSLDLIDPPSADIAADEFLVVNALESGAARLRTALRQVATISLRTGVVVQFGITEEDRRPEESARTIPPPNVTQLRERQDARHFENLATQLFPYMLPLLRKAGFEPHSSSRPSRKPRPPTLPLK